MVNVICCKPLDTPLKEHFLDNHSLLRIIYYNKRKRSENEPTRAQLIGMEFVAIAVGLFLCFVLKGTDPVCRMQDICYEGCKTETGEECEGVKDPKAADMKTYNYLNKTNTSVWNSCYNAALDWKNNGTNDKILTKMICYLPDNPIVNGTTLIKCVVPLEGKACDTEREYISFFNGAASAASAASSLIIPRILEGIFLLVFTICCVQLYSNASQKTVVGVSLGTIFIIFFVLAIYFAAKSTTKTFAFFRILFWIAGWALSAVILEPILLLIQYYVIRCDCSKPSAENKTLINEEDKDLERGLLEESEHDVSQSNIEDNTNTEDLVRQEKPPEVGSIQE